MFKNISSIQPYDTVVGFICIAILYFLRVSFILDNLLLIPINVYESPHQSQLFNIS